MAVQYMQTEKTMFGNSDFSNRPSEKTAIFFTLLLTSLPVFRYHYLCQYLFRNKAARSRIHRPSIPANRRQHEEYCHFLAREILAVIFHPVCFMAYSFVGAGSPRPA